MSIAFWILASASGYFFLRGLLARNRFLELPTIASFLYLAYFVPQAIYLDQSEYERGFGAEFLFLYMTLCLTATAVGFALARKGATSRARQIVPAAAHESRLIAGAVFLSGVGAVANWRLGSIDTTVLGNQWTGVATFWYLLSSASFFGMALAAFRFLQTRRAIYLAIAAVTLITILLGFGANVKRHMIAEVLITLGGAWFFVRHWQPPRVITLAVCFCMMVLLHQVGAVRAYIERGEGTAYSAFIEGVPFERFEYLTLERAPELSIAMLDIRYTRLGGELQGLTLLWNGLVHQYVPAFIVGRDVKESMLSGIGRAEEMTSEYAKYATAGITPTGFSDSYRAFGILGIFVFVALGAFFGWLYAYALYGRLWAQIYYVVLLNDALAGFTESTSRFVVSLPFAFILTFPFLLPKSRTGSSARPHTTPHNGQSSAGGR